MFPEWMSRTELCIGQAALTKLQQASVLVIGLGGVGSYAAEMLCRAGVGRMTIADGDIIRSSNINRQLLALNSTLNRDKTEVMKERLLDINPKLELTVCKGYFKDEAMINLLSQSPFDYIVDAIDTLSPKIYLIYHAKRLGLKVVTSMGAGAKTDPEKIHIADISETYQCPFAYDLRKRLRRLGITEGVKAVFSSEAVNKNAIVHCEDELNKKSLVGTISYIPAIFGCFMASVVIREIISQTN